MGRGAAALLFLAFSAAGWAQTPAGGEFRANTFVIDEQKHALPAVTNRGDFLIVWSSLNQDGSNFGVYGQLYDALGVPQGGEFRVNSETGGLQYATGAVADAGGNYIVVWTSAGPGQDGSGRGIMARVLAPWGAPWTNEFLVNTFTAGRQTTPAVAAQPGGAFVVVWESYGQDGSSYAVVGRRFDARGNPLTGEFLVNAFTPGAQRAARISSDAAGNFVVVWQSAGQDGSGDAVIGRRFFASGAANGGEFLVNVNTALEQQYPVVGTVADGRFVVTWESYGDNQRYGIFARKFDANASPVSGELLVNVYTIDHQHTPTVAAWGDHRFVAAWYSQDQLGFNNQDVFGRQYNPAGVPGPEFLVNAFTTGQQFQAMVDTDDAGNTVHVWDSIGQDGSLNGVYARRMGGLLPAALAVDALAVPSSNGNRVLEVGETVVVQPAWRNVNGATLTFDGVASSFTGPVGGTYTVPDSSAGYGSVPHNAIGGCGIGTGCYAVSVGGVRPVAHWDAQLREDVTVPVGISKAWTLHIGDSFADVPRTSSFYRLVETAFHNNVMPGCASNLFCPFGAAFRDEMAAFVLKSREPHFVPPACVPGAEIFADVPASNPYCPYVEEVARRGVVAGCGGGNYCPSSGVSREQLAVYLLVTLEGPAYSPPPCGVPVFTDVPATSSFCRWVEELRRRGVVTGCGGGAYCPTAAVARDQMSVFLSVTFSLALYGP